MDWTQEVYELRPVDYTTTTTTTTTYCKRFHTVVLNKGDYCFTFSL